MGEGGRKMFWSRGGGGDERRGGDGEAEGGGEGRDGREDGGEEGGGAGGTWRDGGNVEEEDPTLFIKKKVVWPEFPGKGRRNGKKEKSEKVVENNEGVFAHDVGVYRE